MVNFPNKKSQKGFSPVPEQNAFVAFLTAKPPLTPLKKAVSSMVFIYFQYIVTKLIDEPSPSGDK